jgi:hypothetical protein
MILRNVAAGFNDQRIPTARVLERLDERRIARDWRRTAISHFPGVAVQ